MAGRARVALVASSDPGSPGSGGAERQLLMLGEALASEGYDAALLVPEGEGEGNEPARDRLEKDGTGGRGGPAEGEGPRGTVRRIRGWRQHSVPYTRQAMRAADLVRALRGFAPDLVVQTTTTETTGAAAAYCWGAGVPFVYLVAHDDDLDLRLLPRSPGGKVAAARGLELASAIVTQTESQASGFRARYPRAWVRRIPIFPPPSQRARERAPEPVLLWNARFERWKRPEAFVELARRLPARCVMAGPKIDNDPSFDRTREEARGVENLDVVGWVPDVDPLYDDAALLVNTSAAEGFPASFLRAWGRGTPVATLGVDPDGLVSRGLGVVAESVSALAEAVSALLGDPDRLRMCGERCASYVAREHDPILLKRLWCELIEGLVAHRIR